MIWVFIAGLSATTLLVWAGCRASQIRNEALTVLHESNEALYGLQIIDRIKVRGRVRGVTPGNLYPALRELEHDGWLASEVRPGDASRNHLPRVYYRLRFKGDS